MTLEANPTSVEATRFRGFRAAGVNRVSLGVQALDDGALKELGRLHSAREALAAVAVARSNFDRYSFDLIYARPGQTPQAWAAELTRAVVEAGEHLSLYQLTIEQDTPFAALHAAGKLVVPDDDTARALYDTTQAICARAGLPAYEISNHARPGAECRHNLVYWRAQEYAGIGPGAHGRLEVAGGRHATATEKRPESWLMRVEASGHGLITDDVLTREEMSDEFLLMGLRLAEGVDPARYERLSGRPLNPRRIAILREEGAVETTESGMLRVTLSGFPVLDAVVASREIPDTCVVPWASTGWTNNRNVTQMLEFLSMRGEIAIAECQRHRAPAADAIMLEKPSGLLRLVLLGLARNFDALVAEFLDAGEGGFERLGPHPVVRRQMHVSSLRLWTGHSGRTN